MSIATFFADALKFGQKYSASTLEVLKKRETFATLEKVLTSPQLKKASADQVAMVLRGLNLFFNQVSLPPMG